MNILKIFEKIELKKLEEQQENLALRLKVFSLEWQVDILKQEIERLKNDK